MHKVIKLPLSVVQQLHMHSYCLYINLSFRLTLFYDTVNEKGSSVIDVNVLDPVSNN